MEVRFEKPSTLLLAREYMVVDMHFHSRYSHDCSTPIAAIVERAQQLGVKVAITDHNEIQGVIEAQKIAPDVVLPGIEVTTKEGKDILAYFPTVDELELFYRAHVQPHVQKKSSLRINKTKVSAARLLAALEKTNALVALAHPFAIGPRHSYKFFKSKPALMRSVHAFECINQAVPHKRNLLAIGWAAQCAKPLIGGSDAHILTMLGSAFTCAKARTFSQFLEQVRSGQTIIIGEERQMRQHVMNMARILREKTKILQNRKIKRELC